MTDSTPGTLTTVRTCRFTTFVSICLTMGMAIGVMAQEPPKPPASCQRESALVLAGEQIDTGKLLDDLTKRIAVLIRGADVLWPYREDRARAAFTEAFDLAQQSYREQGDKPRMEGKLRVEVADQRYTVIRAISKRDAAWGRKLSEQMLKAESEEAKDKPSKDRQGDARTGAKLLTLAYNLLAADQTSAINFAADSLRYPATFQLPAFLYKLAEANKSAADQFYQQALAAYLNSSMDQFLYLSSYPFGNNREAGEMPSYAYYQVPTNFAPSPALQKLFVQTLLGRAQQMIDSPSEPSAGGRYSDGEQVWMALTRLAAQIDQSLPDLSGNARQTRDNLFAILNQGSRSRVTDATTDRPKKTFDELVDDADRLSDPARREGGLALAVLGAKAEDLEHVVRAAEKIDDTVLRDNLLNWLYFDRAQQALNEKKLDDARRLAAKVVDLDQRAYLYSQIAEQSIKTTKIDTEARDLLEEVLSAAAKAPDTVVKARTLLGVAYLYTKVEPNRSIAVLSDAVKCINHIDSPDFSTDYMFRKIEGKAFGSYASLQTPGLNPENSFREIGKVDFDGALNLAATFADKSLRAMTTLALAEQCLKNLPKPPNRMKSETRHEPESR